MVNHRKQTVVVLCSDGTKWRNEEVYCCERYVSVLKEGDTANIFINTSAYGRGIAGSNPSYEFEGVTVPDNVQHISSFTSLIFGVRRFPLDSLLLTPPF